MRKLLLFLLLAVPLFAQNSRYDSVALGPRGPIPNATVAVCTQPANTSTTPCSPLANLCSSLTDATCVSPNPVTADSLGNYHYYVKTSQGPVTVQIYGPQVASPVVLPDQSIPVTATGFVKSLNNILFADQFAGADAGVKIAACLSALGGYGTCDARGITDPTFNNYQNITGFTCGQGQIVLLPRASFTLQSTITVLDGCALVGIEQSPTSGTIIKAKNALNADMIVAEISGANPQNGSGWWHYGRIENLALDGNKANNTSGNSIRVYQLGDVSILRNLFLNNAADSAIRVDGGLQTGGGVENIACFNPAHYCLNLVQPLVSSGSGTFYGRNLKFQDAGTAAVRVATSSASVTLAGIEAESNGAGLNDPIVLVDSVGNNDTIELSGRIQSNSGTRADVIKINGTIAANNPSIVAHNLLVSGYTNLINDTINTITVPINSVTNRQGALLYGFGNLAPVISNSPSVFIESTVPSGVAGWDICYGDSTTHALKCSYNNGSFFNVPQVIGSGTATMTTAAITAGNCGTTVTVAATGVLTTDRITWSFNAAPAGSNAGLVSWPTANNVNFAYCPNTAETPAAATINWEVVR